MRSPPDFYFCVRTLYVACTWIALYDTPAIKILAVPFVGSNKPYQAPRTSAAKSRQWESNVLQMHDPSMSEFHR